MNIEEIEQQLEAAVYELNELSKEREELVEQENELIDGIRLNALRRVFKRVVGRPYDLTDLKSDDEQRLFELDEKRNDVYIKMTATTMDIMRLKDIHEQLTKETNETGLDEDTGSSSEDVPQDSN